MKIEIATACKPSKQKNDDIAGHMAGTFWLMDGATQLAPPDHGLDAAWHVARLDQTFRRLLTEQPDISLENLARTAIDEAGQDFYATTGLSGQSPQPLRPLCTMILCRLDPPATKLDYLVICDSTLAVIGTNKEIVFTDDRIEQGKPLSKFYALLQQGQDFNSLAAKAEMENAYKNVFNTIGKPGGWFAVGQDSAVVDHAITGSVPLTPKDRILLMSDGFTRAVDTLEIYDSFKTLDEAIEKEGIEKILQIIRAGEMADSTGRKYPRSTPHDDATALRITLG